MSFFDKLGKTVTDTANSVVEKTKSSTDTIRLNNRISEEERNINAAFLSIGKKYVELHPNDAEAAYSEYLDTIVQSQQKIAEYQEQIRKNKHLLLCKNCGAEIPEAVLFCTKCGTENPVGKQMAEERAAREAAERAAMQQAAAAQQSAAAAAGEVCPNCGKPKIPGAMFCTSCGMRYVTPQAAAPAAAPTPVPVPVPAAAPAPETASAPTEAPAPAEEAPAAAPGKTCPNCGHAVPEGNKFCINCGAALEAAPAPAAEAPAEQVCPNCGKSIPAGNKFCTGCGTKL